MDNLLARLHEEALRRFAREVEGVVVDDLSAVQVRVKPNPGTRLICKNILFKGLDED